MMSCLSPAWEFWIFRSASGCGCFPAVTDMAGFIRVWSLFPENRFNSDLRAQVGELLLEAYRRTGGRIRCLFLGLCPRSDPLHHPRRS
ncbi:MAG: hypothetical protein CM1200mP20_01530 [Pseudomonadota bacterium]|nr:MAG: hypothetical protein CM1200mP20_01530 [Pseudomonadota bacterium]